MLLTKDEAQRRRRPSELQAFAEQLRASVRADAVEFEEGMRRHDLYKEFLDEIEPLSQYAMLMVPEDCYVAPVLGNQGFDAFVYSNDGQAPEKIELAKPFDGAASAKESRDLLSTGRGPFTITEPGHEADSLLPIIERSARSKALKDYSDATLVFVMPPLPHYPGLERQYDEQLERLRGTLAAHNFRAKRVFMLVPPSRIERVDA